MVTIISIDTATDKAQVSISQDGKVLHTLYNDTQKDHAGFLQPALQELLQISGTRPTEIGAIAVSNGPGSYTGLRVGLASAKGLCYALQIPLLTLNTLELLAASAKAGIASLEKDALLCPMIDARRMEVFTAVYDQQLQNILPPAAMILDEQSFAGMLKDRAIYFFGNGSGKFKPVVQHPHALFESIDIQPSAMARVAQDSFTKKQFADLAYSEPFYLKEFQAFS